MSAGTYNVLFLCTGNSARSILAESLLNVMGQGRFRAFSAGSRPGGRVNPFALELLARHGMPTESLRSKSWEEFARPAAPRIDFIFTVCDSAAAETCPVWPGHPMSAHWGIPDPATAVGSDEDKRRAFKSAYAVLQKRISLLVNLPIASLDKVALKERVAAIGKQ